MHFGGAPAKERSQMHIMTQLPGNLSAVTLGGMSSGGAQWLDCTFTCNSYQASVFWLRYFILFHQILLDLMQASYLTAQLAKHV